MLVHRLRYWPVVRLPAVPLILVQRETCSSRVQSSDALLSSDVWILRGLWHWTNLAWLLSDLLRIHGTTLCWRDKSFYTRPNIKSAVGQCFVFAGMSWGEPGFIQNQVETRASPVTGYVVVYTPQIKEALPERFGSISLWMNEWMNEGMKEWRNEETNRALCHICCLHTS